MKLQKIFGERNTSTNAVKNLIEMNSNSRVAPSVITAINPKIAKLVKYSSKIKAPREVREMLLDHGFSDQTAINSWKHTATNFDNIDDLKDVHVIFCVRHPASWILGLYRRPYNIYKINYNDLPSFLDSRWTTLGREKLQNASMSAIETYNAKLKSYANLQGALSENAIPYSIVRQEDFAMNQLEVFKSLAPHLQKPKKHPQELKKSTKDADKDSEYYRKYYGEKLWLKDIDRNSLDKINNEIDWSLLTQYDYDPI